MSKLSMIFNSGKNPKWKYFAGAFLRERIPAAYYRRQLDRLLREIDRRPDAREIHDRARYYCHCGPVAPADRDRKAGCPGLQQATVVTLQPIGQSVYYHDTLEYARYFDPSQRLNLLPGDVTFVPPVPSLVKSRPIEGDNGNSVLLNLNKVRHFIFVNDRRPFETKLHEVLFRGKIDGKPNRIEFMRQFYGKAGFDTGAVDGIRYLADHPEYLTEKMTIPQQLAYGAIMALEGNDVASNLKWIMSSNSLAFSPRMRYETWFMEGRLEGGRHYVEIAPDFSDLADKAAYYFSHPREAREIIAEANRYTMQFRDAHREKLISLLTLRRYFDAMG